MGYLMIVILIRLLIALNNHVEIAARSPKVVKSPKLAAIGVATSRKMWPRCVIIEAFAITNEWEEILTIWVYLVMIGKEYHKNHYHT